MRTGDEVELRVERLAYGGEGVGRASGMVVFVDRALPGETARVRLTTMHRRHAEAELLSLAGPSPHRIAPRCRHFLEGCGGCTWQHLDDAGQRDAKAASVRDSLERIGGFRDLPLRPILAAPSSWHYRNKMEFAFSTDGVLGLHPRGAWQRVLPIEECFLAAPLTVSIARAARAFAIARGLSVFDPRTHAGLLRELVVRRSIARGQVMVGLVTAPGPFPEAADLAARLAALDPAVATVLHAVRSGTNDAAPIEDVRVLRGAPEIIEEVRGVRFRIGLGTFFQPNTEQAACLVDLVREFAGPLAGVVVLDLYCGVGMFTLALAGAAGRVAGVELAEAAVVAARENARDNCIDNVQFFASDARHAMPEAIAAVGAPAVVVLDPPRAGAGGKVMRRIGRAGPARVVYVSCNPTTLARDLHDLVPFGYRIAAVQPVDCFPQTFHVETVVLLQRG